MRAGKVYKATKYNVILHYMKVCNLSKADLCRRMKVSIPTLNCWLNDFTIMRLSDILNLCGILPISPEELIYCLTRTKHQVKHKGDKWYIEEIRNKHKDDLIV